jgi:hypothetical protein
MHVGTISTTATTPPEAPRDRDAPRRTCDGSLITFGAAELCALVLWPVLGRNHWFVLDEWDVLATRKATDLGDLFRPHNEHWITVPILVYRAIFTVVGLRSYLPYQLVVVVLHLTAAALLLVVMRRAGVRSWIATAAATLFVFFGSGGPDIAASFQMTFTGAFVLGLAELLLADHDGRIDRRDWLSLVAGLGALMTSGIGVTMVVVTALAVLVRRGWKLALFHALPLGTCYAVWFAVIGHEGYTSRDKPAHLVFDYVVAGFREAFRAMGQLPGVGVILAVGLVVGFALAVVGRHRSRLVAPAALLAGAVVFLTITALGRAVVRGADGARADRYVYLVAAMCLPALAVAADALVRRWSMLLPVALAIFAVGIPGNVRAFHLGGVTDRRMIETLPRDPLAARTPRSVRPDPVSARWVTIGWLRDAARAGRIASPGPLTAQDLANDDFRLSFLQTRTNRSAATCRSDPLKLPATVNLLSGDVIGVYAGARLMGVATPIFVKPDGQPLRGPPLAFGADDGGDVRVLRDVGSVRLSAATPFFGPRVCVLGA